MLDINKVHLGSCLDLFKELGNESIDCIITSPPYWQLRDYKWDGQWGLEPTFQLYLEHLWQMMDEVYRVLKPTGTAWINLGDSYFGSGHGKWSKFDNGEIEKKDDYYGEGRNYSVNTDWDYSTYKAKCLCLIPHRFAIGCIDRGWIMRNDIVWAKRNGMPESVTDRFSKKHEYFFLMVKQEKYYFDLDGIKDKSVYDNSRARVLSTNHQKNSVYANRDVSGGLGDSNGFKNPGSVSDFWDIPTQPSSDEHYAAYNDKLIGKPIIAGCPKGGIILDPFAGTATTGCRALELDRNFIGFEGSEKYVKMANKNLHPYLISQKLF